MYKKYSALNNPQWLIGHKAKTNQTKFLWLSATLKFMAHPLTVLTFKYFFSKSVS